MPWEQSWACFSSPWRLGESLVQGLLGAKGPACSLSPSGEDVWSSWPGGRGRARDPGGLWGALLAQDHLWSHPSSEVLGAPMTFSWSWRPEDSELFLVRNRIFCRVTDSFDSKFLSLYGCVGFSDFKRNIISDWESARMWLCWLFLDPGFPRVACGLGLGNSLLCVCWGADCGASLACPVDVSSSSPHHDSQKCPYTAQFPFHGRVTPSWEALPGRAWVSV